MPSSFYEATDEFISLYLDMVFKHHYLHADPHGGNVLVRTINNNTELVWCVLASDLLLGVAWSWIVPPYRTGLPCSLFSIHLLHCHEYPSSFLYNLSRRSWSNSIIADRDPKDWHDHEPGSKDDQAVQSHSIGRQLARHLYDCSWR